MKNKERTLDEEIAQILDNHLNVLDGRYKEKRSKNIRLSIRTCAKHFLAEIEEALKGIQDVIHNFQPNKQTNWLHIDVIRTIFKRYIEGEK